jgi:hypothetical protein
MVLNDQKNFTLFTSDILESDLPSDTERTYPAKEIDFVI